MISFLEGKLLKKDENRVVVLANGIGYEILLPSTVRQTYNNKKAGEDGDQVALHIFYHQSERQPKPMLVGFNFDVEKEFFEKFIKVEDIGPTAAVKALVLPVPEIARAIEERDITTLTRMKGIGKRTAEKIVATLNGKVGKFALMREEMLPGDVEPEDFKRQVEDVLVKQLGHKRGEASRMVSEALARKPEIASPEELFEDVYRSQKK
ncbi:MAG: Holliday junction branch migration protein RuvA [Deltaproteobacteria bacterium]|jgi:Holliday junction DNA helicase RuvA|nr:Holliday junction branch migration protein RuvA [Deltaproteobacteria bacterium]MBW2183450.1 Holliday junction branch migration protein RuvA [Deltaproteobacteria bacterium]